MTPEQFHKARKALGLTQNGLAKALRMGEHGWQSINRWENGKHTIPGPVAVAIDYMLKHGLLD